MRRPAAIVAAGLVLAVGAQAHYHFVRYLSRAAPWNPVYERFDLNALQNKTVPFLISDQAPALPAGDNYAGLVSQIRLAAKAWSDATASDLRLSFGGFFTPGATLNSNPMIEVVFDELPPGVFAKGGPTVKADLTDTGAGMFVPIVKSTLILPAASERPSWSEEMFLTIVHEFGHCLGLQHTLTSSVMSTSITRGTTKAQPLGADDVAGLATLYPVRGAAITTGVITGRVTLSGAGVNMASVVALSLDGAGISALTRPDGTYRIEGVPAGGTYYVYAHPLPPVVAGESFDAGITPPRDLDGRLLNATTSFDTQFFPGTRDANRAQAVIVNAGGSVDNINFAVTRRTAPAVFGVQTFSFPAQIAVRPAHLAAGGSRSFIVASGYGLNPRAAVTVIGGSAVIPDGGVKAYSQDGRFVQMDLQFNIASGDGARHLTFTLDNDLYVLPSAFRLTRRPPPSLSSAIVTLDATGNRVVVVVGTNLTTDTQILFNGVAGQVRTFDEANGAMTVAPPPGVPGELARVVALNRDGQSSLFVQQPPVYEFESAEAFGFSVSPASLPAGAEAVVEVTGAGANFNPAYVTAAFGSSAIQVRRVFVTGPNRMLVNVAVAPNATPGLSTVSLCNGLRMAHIPGGFQITPAPSRLSVMRGPIVDAASGKTEIPAGGAAQVRLSGPLAEAGSLIVTVGDRPAAAGVQNAFGLLTFQIPASLTPGAAVVTVSAAGEAALPLAVAIDQPPPVVNFATMSGTRVDATRPARPGELISLNVSALAEAGATVANSRVTVTVGIAQHNAVLVAPSNGSHTVQFVLDPFMGTGPQPLTVTVDGRQSAAFTLPVRAN